MVDTDWTGRLRLWVKEHRPSIVQVCPGEAPRADSHGDERIHCVIWMSYLRSKTMFKKLRLCRRKTLK